MTEANQAKDQLNTARQGLTLDRQPALSTLHGASNLNQAQQNNFTQQINAAQNHAALETIKSNITALNNAMTKLKKVLQIIIRLNQVKIILTQLKLINKRMIMQLMRLKVSLEKRIIQRWMLTQ